MHPAVDVVGCIGGAGTREVACRCQGAGCPRRGWAAQRRAPGAGDARRAVSDAAWRVAGALCAGSPGLCGFARGAVHRPRERAPGARGGLRLRAGCGLRARSGRDSRDRPGRSKRPKQPVCGSSRGAFPTGITIDTVGRFGYRLLVTSFAAGKTTLYAFDCRGRTRVVAAGAPHVEGGIEVAPGTFGRYGGTLIAVSEVSGRIYSLVPAVVFASSPNRDFPPAGTSGSNPLASSRRISGASAPRTSRIWEPRAHRRAGRTTC